MERKYPIFKISGGQAWYIAGDQGMEHFLQAMGDAHPDYGLISFKGQQELYEAELKKDDTDYLDRLDPGTPAREFLPPGNMDHDLLEALDLSDHLDTGYRHLSTGQSRKLLLAGAILGGARGLLIQSPFDGLDSQGSKEVTSALRALHARGVALGLFVSNRRDIPSWCTHGAILGKKLIKDRAAAMAGALATHFQEQNPLFAANPAHVFATGDGISSLPPTKAAPLVRLKNGQAGYQGKNIFENLDLTICPGEHTLVTGPNGCGKSTLLALITGDHPACYQNDLHIFGHRRGSGESIWELKEKMGIVSPALHREYHISGDALACVLSGFFDSIGLYDAPTKSQIREGVKWLERLGLEAQAQTAFRELEFADQRRLLIARALVKGPKLLVLDEPTQGLNQASRKAVMDFLEETARQELSTILAVSHRQDEHRNFFVHHLELG